MSAKSEAKQIVTFIQDAYTKKDEVFAKRILDSLNKNDTTTIITSVDQPVITWLEENANLKFTPEHVLSAIDKKQGDKAITMIKSKTFKFTNKNFFSMLEASAKAEFVTVTRTVLGLDVKFTDAIEADLVAAANELKRHKDNENLTTLRRMNTTKFDEYVNNFAKAVTSK